MDYEKKERLMKLKNNMISYGYTDCAEELESIFSELKESEDEKIRNFLIDILSHGTWQKEWPFEPNEVVDWLKRQKEVSKAIETVVKIDKYIDDHVANAHDMSDSNPDKKYCQGWDDALGKVAGILQETYSENIQSIKITGKYRNPHSIIELI